MITVLPSTRKGKKLDVFEDGVKVASIGDTRYPDYREYIATHGQAFADRRRAAYLARTRRSERLVGTPGFYARKFLW